MANKRVISIGSFKESLTRHFPGCIQKDTSSLNGEQAAIAVWEFHLQGSLTTREVSPADTVGEITLSFWQKEEERARRPLQRRTLTTTDLAEMENFVQWCQEWVMGVIHVLTVAFEQPPDLDTEIQPGLAGLLERRT